MIDGKLLATLIGLIVAVLALCNFNSNQEITENFGFTRSLVSNLTKCEDSSGRCTDIPKSDYFFSSSNFQQNVTDGSAKWTAVPFSATHRKEPIIYSKMIGDDTKEEFKEDYCGKCSFAGGSSKASDHHAKSAKGIDSDSDYSDMGMPIAEFSTPGPDGTDKHFKIHERLIYSRKQDRGFGLGDPIRGDLAIAPCNRGWFTPSARPATALRQGAFQVLFGDGSGSSDTTSLVLSDKGGYAGSGSGGPASSTDLANGLGLIASNIKSMADNVTLAPYLADSFDFRASNEALLSLSDTREVKATSVSDIMPTLVV